MYLRPSRTSTSLFRFLSVVTLSLYSLTFSAQDKDNGQAIYEAKCQTCHNLDASINAAPGFLGVMDRWKGNEDLMNTWINNPNAALETGNAYVTSMVAKWKPKFGMMVGQNLTDEEIADVQAYILDPGPEEGGNGACPEPELYVYDDSVDQGVGPIWWVILALALFAVVVALSGVKRKLQAAESIREGGEAPEDIGYAEAAKTWLWDNKTLATIVGLFVTIVFLVAGWDALARIGVYGGETVAENYRPEQPIKFSHHLHAGCNEIPCQYCHSSANVSKTPLIPSANVCMNCHKYIKEGPEHGTKEIAKIYDAVGWDVENVEYTGETKPIEWVKVHELPDHVYFNHAQHVAVGQIECETCHGEVDQMKVVEQVNSLTMGWCINCHNETEVQMADNGYYDEIHARLVTAGEDKGVELLEEYLEDGVITAKELGGWECSKCHY